MARTRTHEQYVESIYKIALRVKGLTQEDKTRIRAVKLSYGAGPEGLRGVTYHNRWMPKCCNGKHKGKSKVQAVPFVAICATGQESTVQVCGTVLHELGHVMAGMGHGHNDTWRQCCERIGLVNIRAAGTEYNWANFVPSLRARLKSLPLPNDGSPTQPLAGLSMGARGTALPPVKLRPCGAGWGVKGGKSRGPGSRSRLLLWECGCDKPVKIRHAGRDLKARCLACNELFVLREDSLPPQQELITT